MKKISYFGALLVLLSFTQCNKDGQLVPSSSSPLTNGPLVITSMVQNLDLPWGLAYLPDGGLLFTERPGKINLLQRNADTYITLMQRPVNTSSEGGQLSITLDPNFSSNHYVYIYETTTSNVNRVVRLIYVNSQLIEDQVIVDQIPYGANHDGGALKFGPDGYLYIGTGDAQQSALAQDKTSLAGKILRVDRSGNAAPGNPFNNMVWTYGHRNVQGFTWTGNGRMLATEHGPSGENGWCCHDEINLIEPGKNYGWPLAYGGAETGTLTPPLINSGDDTWAPSGCTWLSLSAVWPSCLVVATLKGERLIRFYLNGSGTAIINKVDTLQGRFNRLRNIVEAPDGSLIFCTSNKGSITPLADGDDHIYRLYRK